MGGSLPVHLARLRLRGPAFDGANVPLGGEQPAAKSSALAARLSMVAGPGWAGILRAVQGGWDYIAWTFLCGLLPAFPLTLLAARLAFRGDRFGNGPPGRCLVLRCSFGMRRECFSGSDDSAKEMTVVRCVLLAAATLLIVSNSVHADAGFPSLGTPDFEKSSTAGNAFFGLSLAAMFIFFSYWVIRNPQAGLAAINILGGIGFCLFGLISLPIRLISLPILVFAACGAVAAFFGGKKVFANSAPFVGRNLLFLMLSLGAMGMTVISMAQLKWTNPRQEQRRLREQRREKLELEAKERDAKKANPSDSPP